jgi:hypothetical protein
VPVVFRTGAAATRAQLVSAISAHRPAIRAALPVVQGMGADPRTGELVLMIRQPLEHAEARRAEIAAIAGVPVRIRVTDAPDNNMSIEGGGRVEGPHPDTGQRVYCTTGFVVTDGARRGVLTAAHCPDTLSYRDPEGGDIPLTFVGGWGAQYQDVQVHVSAAPHRAIFYGDTAKRAPRRLEGARSRAGTRAGETVCHRGETTGYSCAEVDLVDYAPAGELCGGPCDPVWVTVAGPTCRGGDSGGPVFRGGTAFGILKGGSYAGGGRCNFYYYMSTDYLPDGWSLLRE